VAGESLKVTAGKAAGSEIALDDEFVIGRATTGDGKLGDDPELSRRHARLAYRAGGQLTIEDLGSTNGTFLNGRPVSEVQPLKPGDTIQVGTTTLQVLDSAGNAPQATRLGAVPPPKEQATAPGAGAAATPAAAAAVAAGAAAEPAAQQPPPPGRPAAPPPSSGGRKGPPVPVLVGAGVLVVALIVVGIVVLAGGGGDDNDKPKVLTSAEIVRQNSHATISIDTRGPGFDDNGDETVVSGGGSGVVLNAQKGWILTNNHVIAGATSVKAHLENGDVVSARVLGNAPCEDVAVVETTTRPPGLKAGTLGRSAGLAAGAQVTALGFPGAFESDITQRRLQSNGGEVSSKPGPASLGGNLPSLPSVIQHDASINAGNSGGPLFDDHGQVVGINTFSAASSGSQNQNGAIAIDRIKTLLPALERGEDRGYAGWNIETIESLNNKLYVIGVDANSPADKAGMLFGDRIDKLDNTEVANVPDVCDILGSKTAGDSLKVEGQQLDGRFYTTTLRLR
jgi:S1-C subfamily serine protease